MATDEGLDDVLAAIGCGLWQLPVLILTILTHLVIPVHMMGSALLSAPVSFKCSHSSTFYTNLTSLSNLTFPNTTFPDRTSKILQFNSQCLDEESLRSGVDVSGQEEIHGVLGRPTAIPSCPYVVYDDSIFSSTVITEWDLICEKEMMRPLFQMMYSIGALFGSFIGGQVSDSFGRKRAVQVASFINLFAVIILYAMPYYMGALFARVLLGGSCNFMVLPAYSLALEICPPKYRTLVGMLLGTAFSAGIIILAGLGYFIRSWKLLMLLDAAIPFVFLLPLSFWIIESPRWLIQHGRVAEASKIITKAVIVNKVSLDQSLVGIIEGLRENSDLRSTGSDLKLPSRNFKNWCRSCLDSASAYFRSKALLVIMIVSPLIWILQGCLYLGIILNANNFTSNNPFVYVTVSGLMDLIALLLATPLSMRIGRKVLMICAFLLGGILLIIDLFVPQEILWLKFILVMTALMLVAASFQINFLYTPELYPTVIRARGFAFSALAGNIGFLVAPLITDLLSSLTWWSVSVTFGCAGIVASLLVPFLPETLHKPLPETVQDVEKRHRMSKSVEEDIKLNGRTEEDDSTEAENEECEALNPS